MPSLPSLASDKPSNSDTSMDPESVTNKVASTIDDAGASKGSSAAAQTKAGVSLTASEATKAADRLYEENIEDEYAKREGGAWEVIHDRSRRQGWHCSNCKDRLGLNEKVYEQLNTDEAEEIVRSVEFDKFNEVSETE